MEVHVNKTVPITYKMVVDAYGLVKRGGKAVGIDKESWEEFDRDSERNLYTVWNRLASGSYHPQGVREKLIPKKDGSHRKLGIPTIRDRIAQCVVKEYMEKRVDELFHQNSYGYRPKRSSKEAILAVRENCLAYDWVIDLDISKFFDEIDHELMMKAVEKVMPESWVRMYVKRWLEMKRVREDGTEYAAEGKGTPQGGVISPLLTNLYLHYALDMWLGQKHPGISFVRYADDMILHCGSKSEAEQLLSGIEERLGEVKLRLNMTKTKVVYCKDYRRTLKEEQVQFNFLGYSYQPRAAQSKYSDRSYMAYTTEISKENAKKIRQEIKDGLNWNNTTLEIRDISVKLNAKLRGWINYFGLYGKRKLRQALMELDLRLARWLKRKRKYSSIKRAVAELSRLKEATPHLFYHWQKGYCMVY
jgi:RNA-directed DNA polymerase